MALTGRSGGEQRTMGAYRVSIGPNRRISNVTQPTISLNSIVDCVTMTGEGEDKKALTDPSTARLYASLLQRAIRTVAAQLRLQAHLSLFSPDGVCRQCATDMNLLKTSALNALIDDLRSGDDDGDGKKAKSRIPTLRTRRAR
uniref:Uncharacterized protein n=1 Tax=Plectus sambesii TaxID=2011161 RepID=A0A914V636_9BILA